LHIVFIYYFSCTDIFTFSEKTLLLNIIIIIHYGFLVSYETIFPSGCMSFTGMAPIPKTKPGWLKEAGFSLASKLSLISSTTM